MQEVQSIRKCRRKRYYGTNEATAAVGLAYQKVGAALPDIQVGDKVADLIKAISESVYAAVGEKIAVPKPYSSFSASSRIFIFSFPIIS